MAEDKPRLARLASILIQLQSKSLVTSTELAEKHQVSIRTIYRDIRTLEQSGVPIVMEEGKGYSILEGYQLPPVMFTEEEANALITAEQIINRNKDRSLSEQYQSAVTKVKAVLKSTQKEKVALLENRLQIRNNPEELKTSNFLIELQSAITSYQIVRLNYVSLSGEASQRDVEPFALFSTQENWLLVAWCRLRTDFRAFRLDHIREISPTGQHFEPHDMTLSEYFEQCREKLRHP